MDYFKKLKITTQVSKEGFKKADRTPPVFSLRGLCIKKKIQLAAIFQVTTSDLNAVIVRKDESHQEQSGHVSKVVLSTYYVPDTTICGCLYPHETLIPFLGTSKQTQKQFVWFPRDC